MLPKVVLVADTDVRVRDAIQVNLASLGPLVLTARSGDRALELSQEVRPSVVLLGMDVAGMTAGEVAVRLRAHPATSTVPIILLAPREVGESVLKSLGLSRISWIRKPFESAELIASIRIYLD